MTQDDNDQAAWLRFFLHRIPVALRYAPSAETLVILRELIQEIENRLDEVEKPLSTPEPLARMLARAPCDGDGPLSHAVGSEGVLAFGAS